MVQIVLILSSEDIYSHLRKTKQKWIQVTSVFFTTVPIYSLYVWDM